MIKKYNQFILERKKVEQTNEGLKDWVAAFMLLANVGVVPLSITTANAQTKKEFVEKQPQDKIDAAKFVEYINNYGAGRTIDKVWDEYILKDKTIKSNLTDVKKYLNKDGKIYHFDKKYQEQDFSNVDIHNIHPVNYLTDMGNFIDDSREPEINNFIYEYEKQTSVEICIITVPTLNGEDPFQYSLNEFNHIGVGKSASDNGILIMVSMQDRKWEIRTGYGVEGLLPDITCSHIGNDIIVPNFKEGDYFSGIMGAIQEIKKNIDKNPEEIKKFKEEQDAKSAAELKELWTDIGMGALVFAIISTLIILVYRRWKNASDMMDDIREKMTQIENMRKMAKSVGISEVDDLYDKFKKIINAYSLSSFSTDFTKPKFYQVGKHADFLMNQKKRIESLSGIYGDITEAYEKWNDKKSRLDKIKSTVSSYSIGGIISAIDLGFQAWSQLKDEYGVDMSFDPNTLKSKASELTGLIDKIDNAYKSSISEAERIMSDFEGRKSLISSSVGSVQSMLSKYKTAEQKISNWKSLVNSAISDMERYKRWGRSSEESEISSAVSSFESKVRGYNKSNLLKLVSELESLLSKIDDMRRKWKRRKEEEEEEEERRRRAAAAAASSYSSSHSSSSSSSFGGFGGGSSGGGGAGGSW